MQQDHEEIRQLIDNWVIFRDGGDWERFATVWHPDGRMMATWFQASATDFIARSRAAWDAGLTVFHTLGGGTIDIDATGTRAVAQTKMQIIQRAPVHGVLVDVSCHGRFWDAFEKRDGRWGMVLRQPIYELDRMSPVDPAATLALEPALLASFPVGYCHLGYLQSQLGLDVNRTSPGTRGPEVEWLQQRGVRWLAGDDIQCLHAPRPVNET